MLNYLRSLISKNKYRFVDRKYNLDLSYITPRIIAMAFPGNGIFGIIRNNIDEVSNFLRERHGDNYLVINLSGKTYDNSKFNNNVIEHRLVDHHAPSLNSLFEICYEIHKYLTSNISNVVVVNCRAGKGRAGTVICCYLLYSGRFKNPDEVFAYYSLKRFYKGEGVTQPSQRRYVEYFYSLLTSTKRYFPYRIRINSIKIKDFDKNNKNGQYISPYCDFYVNNSEKITSSTKENYFSNKKVMVMNDMVCITDEKFFFDVAGDITIKISINDMFFVKKLGKISFNTAFIDKDQKEIIFKANEVDPDHLLKKKKVPNTYQIIIGIQKLCECENTTFSPLCKDCEAFLEKNNSLKVWNKIIRLVEEYQPINKSNMDKGKIILFGDIDEDDIDYVLSKVNKSNSTNKISNINSKDQNKIDEKENEKIFEINVGKEEEENAEDYEESDDSYEESSEEEDYEEEDNGKFTKKKKKKNLNDSFENECIIF